MSSMYATRPPEVASSMDPRAKGNPQVNVGGDPFSRQIQDALSGLMKSEKLHGQWLGTGGGPSTRWGMGVQDMMSNMMRPGAAIGQFGRGLGGALGHAMQPGSMVGPFGQANAMGLGQFQMGGGGPTTQFGRGMQGHLQGLLQRGGELDRGVVNQRLETAREGLDRQRAAQTSQLEAQLADRGLLGGGAEVEALQGLERDLAEQYAGSYRDILSAEQEAANQRYAQALGMGTGWADQQAKNLLGSFGTGVSQAGLETNPAMQAMQTGLGFAGLETNPAIQALGFANQSAMQQPQNMLNALAQGTNRQNVLSQIALQSLAQDQDFAKFLAQFGLEREKTLEDMRMGRMSPLIGMLNTLLSAGGQAAKGFI